MNETTVYAKNGLIIKLAYLEAGARITVTFDRPKAKGTLVLEDTEEGLAVRCPEVCTNIGVALLSLFSGSPVGQEVPGGPPLQIDVVSPAQAQQLCEIRCFQEGTRVRFDAGASETVSSPVLNGKEFGIG